MSTVNQKLNKSSFRKIQKNRATLLKTNPQFKSIVTRIRIATPKKPNSARRPVCRVMLTKDKKLFATAHIPGGKHTLRKHSVILISGVGARDLPGVNYSCVRGVYDFSGGLSKLRRRSIYGVKIPDSMKKKLRRKFRLF